MSYTFDESGTTRLHYARVLLGDTDINPTTHALYADESITNALTKFGWKHGMAFLVTGLLTRFGQEPSKYVEGEGATVDYTQRLVQWQKLKDDIMSGLITDPDLGQPANTVGVYVSEFADASFNF